VQDAITALGFEREAFAKERASLLKTTVNSAEVSDTLRRATAHAIPTIEAAAEKAIASAMEKALGFTGNAAAQVWGTAATPVLERFSRVVQTAQGVEERVRQISVRYAWQWAVMSVLGILDKCGPEGRLCIEVAPDQGIGRGNFKGAWVDSSTLKSFVIPKGWCSKLFS
jgi:hypothetical protein